MNYRNTHTIERNDHPAFYADYGPCDVIIKWERLYGFWGYTGSAYVGGYPIATKHYMDYSFKEVKRLFKAEIERQQSRILTNQN